MRSYRSEIVFPKKHFLLSISTLSTNIFLSIFRTTRAAVPCEHSRIFVKQLTRVFHIINPQGYACSIKYFVRYTWIYHLQPPCCTTSLCIHAFLAFCFIKLILSHLVGFAWYYVWQRKTLILTLVENAIYHLYLIFLRIIVN